MVKVTIYCVVRCIRRYLLDSDLRWFFFFLVVEHTRTENRYGVKFEISFRCCKIRSEFGVKIDVGEKGNTTYVGKKETYLQSIQLELLGRIISLFTTTTQSSNVRTHSGFCAYKNIAGKKFQTSMVAGQNPHDHMIRAS